MTQAHDQIMSAIIPVFSIVIELKMEDSGKFFDALTALSAI